MWPLFRPLPPLESVGLSTRDVVSSGALIQRELVSAEKFCSLARDRQLSGINREVLEEWDHQGILQPLAVSHGGWQNWHEATPYPVDGISFRDEQNFQPWSDYPVASGAAVGPTVLYSEWQFLYLPIARAARSIQVPVDTMLQDGTTVADWADSHRPFTESQRNVARSLHSAWLPTVLLLLRLQARHWPFVHGRSVMVYDADMKQVDALNLELDAFSAATVFESLKIDLPDVALTYRWLGDRAQSVDPVPELFDLLRLSPRRALERTKGARRQALDFYDAAEILRRFYREVSGDLLRDVDQHGDETPRTFGRSSSKLVDALRRHRLYPYSLHVVVEGATEVEVVERLFEAFAGRTLDGAGIALTNLRGDRLEQSADFLEGFGSYADSVAVLVDNENDVERVTRQMSESGRIPDLHVTLSTPNLEEENFSLEELLEIAREIAADRGESLKLTPDELRKAAEERPKGARRKGLVSILISLARSERHGAVILKKPEIGRGMAERILEEIETTPGHHYAVAEHRPIVRWMLAYPIRAYQNRS